MERRRHRRVPVQVKLASANSYEHEVEGRRSGSIARRRPDRKFSRSPARKAIAVKLIALGDDILILIEQARYNGPSIGRSGFDLPMYCHRSRMNRIG